MRFNDIDGVINTFKQEHVKLVEQGYIRNYCFLPVAKLATYGKRHGYDIKKVQGEFVVDNPEFEFDDFTQQEKASMQMQYLDPHSKEDRIKYATKNNLFDELKRVPHHWNEYHGKIIDLTGQAQFVDTGLASDLNASRYII